MDLVMKRGVIAKRPVGIVVSGVLQGDRDRPREFLALDRATRGAISAAVARRAFSGKFLETCVLYPPSLRAGRVLLLGLGRAGDLTPHRLRLAAAVALKRVRELGVRSAAYTADPRVIERLGGALALQATAEGMVLGYYRHTAYRSGSELARLRRVEIVVGDQDRAGAVSEALERGRRWGEAVCLARDLASTPGQDLTPERLGERAREVAESSGAKARVLGPTQLERLGMGALLAVGRGSVHPPRFIVLEHAGTPRSSAPPIVVIGKGVTFDSGGISIKPRENMHRMKYDMSGAAAVLGLFAALPSLERSPRIVGLIPSAENMPGGRAYKPGDVVRALDGTTIEVTNTDAEGRLLLADALGFARGLGPELVVDLATLTGAVTIALGHLAAGLFTDDEALAAELLGAAESSGERLWRLPLWDDYASGLASDTADLVNSAGKEGAAILGAMFLKRFARGMRWAHLDIASTAWSPSERAHEPRGPTGFGVRLLLEWISRRSAQRGV